MMLILPIREFYSLHGHARNLGGLARATADAALCSIPRARGGVLIETVGVGQDEIDVVRLAE